MQKCVLVITDGIGINKDDFYNAFAAAKKPNYERLDQTALRCELATSGLAVGLLDGVMGNSEVGHMSIGAGRVIYQNLVKINRAIEDKSLEKNEKLQDFLASHSRVHIIGLYSDGAVHSHFSHLNEIAKISAKKCQVFTHLISDGRDVLPSSFADFYAKNPCFITPSSVAGRFFAMDRDNNFERTREYVAMLKNPANSCQSIDSAVQKSYEMGVFDEFITPCKLDLSQLLPTDAVIITNFRSDRARQLASELKDFLGAANVLCMCEYDAKLNLDVIFPKENIKNTLAEVLSHANLRQFHTAETEKYAHVSFFFNGGIEQAYPGEVRALVPSPKVKSYDELPQMSAYAVCEKVLAAMDEGFEFVVVNFANGDMVGHTGNFDAAVAAVSCVDECIGKIMQKAVQKDYALLLTSDHGNCEQMMSRDKERLTNHTTFDVFCWLYNHAKATQLRNGSLSNIAATVLKILDIKKPDEMDEPLF